MTTDLEKQFFDTFGIEKIIPCYKCNMQNTNWDCKRICLYDDEKRKEYPQITDRILLELICILLSNNSPYMFKLGDWDVEKLKDTVLAMCIKLPDFLEWEDTSEYFKHQVQALFEEG